MLRGETIEDDPQAIALQALAWTLSDEKRASRLLALTGLDADALRDRLGEASLLAAVFEFLESHQPDLVACAEALGLSPERLVTAHGKLAA